MDEFRGKPIFGRWWEPERPAHVYQGALEIEENNHGTLTLRGTEADLKALPCHPGARIFFGHLANWTGHRSKATLLYVGMMRGPGTTSPSRPDRETDATFYTNHIIIGNHVANDDEAFIDGAYIDLSGLKEWCSAAAFGGAFERPGDGLATETVKVSFQASASPYYDLGEGRLLRILSEYQGPFFFEELKEISIAEKNTLELRFPKSISLKQLLNEIHIWQTLITIGLRQASYMKEVILLVSAGGGSFNRTVFMTPGRKPDQSERPRDPRLALFNQSKLGSSLGKFLKAWREKQTTIETVVLLITGTTYQDDVYIHNNLLTCLQSLEILHRETLVTDRFPDKQTRRTTLETLRDAIPQNLEPKLKDEISDQLAFIGALTLLDRLRHLFSLYPKCLGPLFLEGDADMVLLKDVRNFLTHYGSQKSLDTNFLWSQDAFSLKEKAQLFLEICLLGTIALNDNEIFGLVQHFTPYKDCRFEASMKIANKMIQASEATKKADPTSAQ